jgi:hypothetical protein
MRLRAEKDNWIERGCYTSFNTVDAGSGTTKSKGDD